MSLISRLAGSLVKRGRFEVQLPGGRRETLGPGGGKEGSVGIADAKALRQLLR